MGGCGRRLLLQSQYIAALTAFVARFGLFVASYICPSALRLVATFAYKPVSFYISLRAFKKLSYAGFAASRPCKSQCLCEAA